MSEWYIDACPQCGAQLDETDGDVLFCKYCGARLRRKRNETIYTHNININKRTEHYDYAQIEAVKAKKKSDKEALIVIFY